MKTFEEVLEEFLNPKRYVKIVPLTKEQILDLAIVQTYMELKKS